MSKASTLIYVGPHEGVDVALPSGREVTILHGQPAEFPPEVAASLLEQGEDHWTKSTDKSAKKEE